MTPPDGATVAAARNPRLCPPPSVDRSTQPSQPSTYHRQRHRLVTLVPSALLLLYSLLLLSVTACVPARRVWSLRGCICSSTLPLRRLSASAISGWASMRPTSGSLWWEETTASTGRARRGRGYSTTPPRSRRPCGLNLSAVDSPYVGGGPQGALVSSESTLASSFVAHHPELIVWGGHSAARYGLLQRRLRRHAEQHDGDVDARPQSRGHARSGVGHLCLGQRRADNALHVRRHRYSPQLTCTASATLRSTAH